MFKHRLLTITAAALALDGQRWFTSDPKFGMNRWWTCQGQFPNLPQFPLAPPSSRQFTGPVIAALPPNQGIDMIILHSEPGPCFGELWTHHWHSPTLPISQRVGHSWSGCCSAARDHWSATFPRRPWWIAENRFVPACNRWTLPRRPRRPRSSRLWHGTILMKPKKYSVVSKVQYSKEAGYKRLPHMFNLLAATASFDGLHRWWSQDSTRPELSQLLLSVSMMLWLIIDHHVCCK